MRSAPAQSNSFLISVVTSFVTSSSFDEMRKEVQLSLRSHWERQYLTHPFPSDEGVHKLFLRTDIIGIDVDVGSRALYISLLNRRLYLSTVHSSHSSGSGSGGGTDYTTTNTTSTSTTTTTTQYFGPVE